MGSTVMIVSNVITLKCLIEIRSYSQQVSVTPFTITSLRIRRYFIHVIVEELDLLLYILLRNISLSRRWGFFLISTYTNTLHWDFIAYCEKELKELTLVSTFQEVEKCWLQLERILITCWLFGNGSRRGFYWSLRLSVKMFIECLSVNLTKNGWRRVELDTFVSGRYLKPLQVWNCREISLNLVNSSYLMLYLMLNSKMVMC